MEKDLEILHEIKCWPEFFGKIALREKEFELRKNDRDYQVGEIIKIREYVPNKQRYTGSFVLREISYMLTNTEFGLKEGYCILQLKTIDGWK